MGNAGKKSRLPLCALLAFLAAFAAHAPALSGSFLWDDASFVRDNPFVSDCANLGAALSPSNFIKVLPVPMSARPAVNVSLIADACGGYGAAGMRLTNLLLHSFNAVLVFSVLVLLSGSEPAALFGAVVFGVHPLAAEAVNIITFRSHLLGFFFFTSGLLASLFYSRGGRAAAAASAAACYFLAVMSSETAVMLPAAALLAAYFDSGRSGLRRLLPLAGALAAVAAFYIWFRIPRSGYAISGVSTPGIAGPSLFYPSALLPAAAPVSPAEVMTVPWHAVYASHAANLYTMARVTAEYLRSMVFPLWLSADYAPRVYTSLRQALPSLLAVSGFFGAAAFLFARRRLSGLAGMLLLAGLLPALNLWPIYNIKADRYLYLPTLGLAAGAAAFFRYSLARSGRRTAAGLALAWAGALLFLAVSRSGEFRDDRVLFSAAVELQPASPRARENLSAALLRAGDCGGGLQQARAAAGLDAEDPLPRSRLAFGLAACGRRAEALKEADRALELAPANAPAMYLAGLLRLKGDRKRGLELLRRAAALAPGYAEIPLTVFLAEKKNPAALGKADREHLAALKDFYERAGLSF